MSENCYQELGTSRDVSTSDDDSVSLLTDMNGQQNKVAVEDAEKGRSHLQGVIVPKQMLENEIFPPEKVKGLKRRCDHPSGANHGPTSKASSSSWMKIPSKARVHKRNEKGETLLFAACRRKDVAQVKMLIQAGISVNVTDYAGWTALHDAAAAGDWTVVEELLKAGAHVNTQSTDGSMPLHDAVFCGHSQVVKLLLQSGSSFSDRNVGGLTALEVAEKNITDLLSSLQTFSGLQKLSADQHQQAETSCQTPLFYKTGLRLGWSYLTNVPLRASGDTEGAREPGDIQLRKEDRTGNAMTVIFNTMERIQTDMSSWPLTCPEDKGRYYQALTQIEDVLNKVLTAQHLEMDKVAQKSRGVSGVRKLMWKNHLSSLVPHQRSLVKILEKQMQLIEAYVNVTAKASNHNCAVVEEQPGHFSTHISPKSRKEQGSCSHGDRFRHTVTRKNMLLESQCNKNSTSLWNLVKSGVVPTGGALKIWSRQERWHHAHVNDDSSIRDQEGKTHLTPEQWVESIFENNIPVSSEYAWNKIMFRGKHLSHYLSSSESEENTPQTHLASSQRSLDTEADSLSCLMKIKMIHLVDDEEMLPNAVVDHHWEKLLKTDYSVAEGWHS